MRGTAPTARMRRDPSRAVKDFEYQSRASDGRNLRVAAGYVQLLGAKLRSIHKDEDSVSRSRLTRSQITRGRRHHPPTNDLATRW
jgi:hypothetical protein